MSTEQSLDDVTGHKGADILTLTDQGTLSSHTASIAQLDGRKAQQKSQPLKAMTGFLILPLTPAHLQRGIKLDEAEFPTLRSEIKSN